MIVAVPDLCAETSPAVLTVATSGALLLHVMVVVAVAGVMVAVSDILDLGTIFRVALLSAMPVTVPIGAVGSGVGVMISGSVPTTATWGENLANTCRARARELGGVRTVMV